MNKHLDDIDVSKTDTSGVCRNLIITHPTHDIKLWPGHMGHALLSQAQPL